MLGLTRYYYKDLVDQKGFILDNNNGKHFKQE